MKRAAVLSVACIVAMLACFGWARGHLPDQIAIRWGASGAAVAHAPREVGLGIIPVIATLVAAFFWIQGRRPRAAHLRSPHSPYATLWSAIMLTLLFAELLIVAKNGGGSINVPRAAIVGVATLVMLIGNCLGKLQRNAILGLRTRATLESGEVWDRTHRTAGILLFATGSLIIGAAITAPPSKPGTVFLTVAFVVATTFCVLVPYFVARRLPHRR